MSKFEWKDQVKTVLSAKTNIASTEQVNECMDTLISKVITEAWKHRQKYSDPAKVLTDVHNYMAMGSSTIKEHSSIVSNYRLAKDQRDALIDHREQEARSSRRDRFQAYFLRIATAGTIAGIVLLTGYLAQRWSIPLPLLRLSS